jgi:hypothetical protein
MNGQWTGYRLVRQNLAPEFAELSDEQIDELVGQFYGEGFTGEDLEGFFDNIGRGLSSVAGAVGNFAQKAAPVVMNTLPGIAQGAMAGSALGPFGMLAGAIAGGAGSALSQAKDPTLRGIGRGLGTATQLASSIRGGGVAGGVGGLLKGGLSQLGGRGGAAGGVGGLLQGGLSHLGGRGGAAGRVGGLLQGGLAQVGGHGGAGGALGGITNLFGAALQGAPGQALPAGASANTLLGMLARPEVGHALMSAAMGGLGRQSVPMGSSQVDVQSILNALSSLAGQAADEMAGTESESLPEYFYDEDGELAFDPAERHSRTNALLTYMVLTAPSWAQRPPAPVVVVQPPPQREPVYTEADAEADQWLWAEVYDSDYQEDEAYA